MRLTEAQARILGLLSRRKEYDGPPDTTEISLRLGHVSYWSHGKLKSLEKRGLVEALGYSFRMARCWAITPAGRRALQEQGGGDAG